MHEGHIIVVVFFLIRISGDRILEDQEMRQSSTEIFGLDEPCADLGQFGALDLHHLVLKRCRNLSSILAIFFSREEELGQRWYAFDSYRPFLHPLEKGMKSLLDAAFAGLTNLIRCRQNNRFYVVKGSTRELESVQRALGNLPFTE